MFIKIVLGIYIITTFFQSWFYMWNNVYAASIWNNESQKDYTNIVAIIVNKKIYDNNKIRKDIEWYATEYIQWKWNKKYTSVSNSKALVFPIDVDTFSTKNIAQLLENIYFDWIKWEPSKLVWLVLIWDIPLPVVNQDGYIYPTIYPYVDFEDQKFIWDDDSKYFVYNNNSKWQAEIWHWMINFWDDVREYLKYFSKLNNYFSNPEEYIWKAIWYEDFIWNNKYFNDNSLNFYLNNFLFAEDLWYHRYSDLMVKVMQWQRNKEMAELMESLNSVNSWQVDLSGMDVLSELSDNMNTPTMQIKAMLDNWYLSSYSSLFGQKYLKNITNNVETANRWIESRTWSDWSQFYLNAFDSVYKKAEVTDEVLLRKDWWLEPFLIMINNALEDAVDQKVEEEKYRLDEVLPLTYLKYEWRQRFLRKCVWEIYDAYENYFFGTNAKYVKTAEETSTYRWTFRNYIWIDGLTISGIQNSQNPSTDVTNLDLNKKSIWWSYEIFATQVDANRWYNYNNSIEENEIYSGNKTAVMDNWDVTCVKKFLWICIKRRWAIVNTDWSWCDLSEDGDTWWCENPMEYAIRIWWWASPLNLDMNWVNFSRKSWYFYTWATSSIFDIAWSTSLPLNTPEYESNSYQSVNKYSNLTLRRFSPDTEDWPKFKSWNPLKKKPDSYGIWYDYSMDYEVKFTNRVPEFDGRHVSGWSKKEPLTAWDVDYFRKYDSSAEKQWNVIKITKILPWGDESCQWAWEIYTYKTLDSRVKNDSVNADEVNGKVYKIFQDDSSHVKQFYMELFNYLDAISGSVSAAVWSETWSLNNKLQFIKAEINDINSWFKSIMDFDLDDLNAMNTWAILSKSRDWINTFDDTKATNLLSAITGAQDDVLNLKWLVDFWDTLFDGVIDFVDEQKKIFQINWWNLIFLVTRKHNINQTIAEILDNYKKIKTTVSEAGIIYGTINELWKEDFLWQQIPDFGFSLLEDLLSLNVVENLSGKKERLWNLLNWSWCETKYRKLCEALDVVIDNYNEYVDTINEEKQGINKLKIQKFDDDGNIMTWQFDTIDDIFKDLFFNTIFTRIDNSEILDSVYTGIGTIPETMNEELTWIIPWMNMTTSDRPIDSPRYLTFKWIWWDKVTFIYPDIYKAEIFSWDSNVLLLKSTWDIENAIKWYLRGVVDTYNKYLRIQSQKNTNYYNANSLAYNTLETIDSLANPNHKWDEIRPYNLFDRDYLINQLENAIMSSPYFSGEELAKSNPIWFIAEMIYYQNVTWQAKTISGTIQWDFDNQRVDFDINEKVSYLMDNYLVKDNDKWSYLTPSYRPDWYEVAFINSDWNDRIIYENTPDIVDSVSTASTNYNAPRNTNAETLPLEEALLSECNIPMDQWVLLFQLSGLSVTSPWFDALECWRKQIKEKPFEFSIKFPFTWDTWASILNNIWNIFDWDEYQDIWETYQSYVNQWKLLDTDNINESILSDLEWSSSVDLVKLQQILSYTVIKPNKSIISADNPNWEIEITSSKQLWNVDFKVVNVWGSKIKIFSWNSVISNNITAWTWWFSTWTFTFDPYNRKTLTFKIDDPNEWLNVVFFYLCLPWTQYCVNNSFRLDVVPWEVKNVKIEMDRHTVLEWASVPFKLKWTDIYGNEIWELISQQFETFVYSWLLMLKWVKSQSIKVSNFDKTNFSFIATGWNLDWKTVSIQVSWSIDQVPWIKATEYVNVVKWRLDTYSGNLKLASWSDIINWLQIQLPDKDIYFTMNQPNTWTLPHIDFKLVDKNGNLINIDWKISVRTKNGRVLPWDVILKNGWDWNNQYKFSQAKSFNLSWWTCVVYLLPNFSAWEDVIYISMEWVDNIELPVVVRHASPKVLWLSANNTILDPNSSIDANLKLFDNRWNIIDDDETIFVVLWSANDRVSLSKSWNVRIESWSLDFVINSNDKWGLWYVYAYIHTGIVPMDKQNPDTLQITIQETMLPKKDLNVMYLNLFGNDWWNQWWYMSDNKKYSESLINNSDKLITVTTQLLGLENIKYYPIVIDSWLQINNFMWSEINFKLSTWFIFDIDEIWTISVNSNWFTLVWASISEDMLGQYIVTMMNWTYKNKNVLFYIPEQTDSIIESNEIMDKAIYINWHRVFDIRLRTFDKNLTISLQREKIAGYQVWKVFYDSNFVWRILFAVDNRDIISMNLDSKSADYLVGSTWINWSSDEYWMWFYEKDSSLPTKTLWYKSIQDSYNSMLWIWFTSDFKNITNFGWWMPVWEATLPFGSEFLINIWDPLLKRINNNDSAKIYDSDGNVQKDTEFDLWLWEVIYSDPDKEIFKVINIDFNNDELDDIIVIYKDWTVNMLKNYWWTNPFQNLWPLMKLAERISDVSVWDVDWNGYEDILVWTVAWWLRVYLNHKWIFDVDWYPVCINVNVDKWEISEHPEKISGIHQIFLKDMDLDWAMDIVTNDSFWFIKIFYWWNNNWVINYVSNNKYMCDEDWYDRVQNNSKVVYQFGIKIDPNSHVLDQSLIRWVWISDVWSWDSDDDVWVDFSMLENDDLSLDDIPNLLNNITNFDVTKSEWLYLQSQRLKKAWFGIVPIYESWIDNEWDIDYVEIWALTWTDPVKIYKVYEDMNHNPIDSNLVDTTWSLIDWDLVRVTVYIDANEDFTWTFIDRIAWPWIIPISQYDDNTFENFWFDSDYIRRWYITSWQIENITPHIHWDLNNARYMLDNIGMKRWDKLKFSYGLIYTQYNSFDIDVDTLTWNNFSGVVFPTETLNGYSNDKYPDISIQLKDWCNKSMFVFFNNWHGVRDYVQKFMDLGKLIEEYNENSQSNYEWATSDVEQELWDGATNGDFQQVYSSVSELAGGLFETIDWKWMLSQWWVDVSNLLDAWTTFVDALTSNATNKIDEAIWSACNWFSVNLGWWWGCGLPVPFNQAFLWVWKYHVFGCYEITPLTKLIGNWMPVLNIPGNWWPTPYWVYIPAPWIFGFPFKAPWTDKMALAPDWAPQAIPSLFRVYVMPTLTLDIWFALCFGPQVVWNNIPEPFSNIVWNCIVFSIDPCGKKSWNDSQWPNSMENIPEEYTFLRWCDRQNNPLYLMPRESASPFVFWWSSTNMNSFQPIIPGGTYAGWFINIEVSPEAGYQYQESSPLDIDEIILEWWASVQNAIRWSTEQWLIQKIVKQWLDKQIKYIMTQLTNFKVTVIWPDFESLLWNAPAPSSSNAYPEDPEEMKKECEKNKGQWIEGEEARKQCGWKSYCCKETEAEQKLKCENRWKQRDSVNKKCVKKISQNFEDEALASIDTWTQQNLLSKEQISSWSNFANPFKELEDQFSQTPLININTQDIMVNVPMITSEDITSYISMSQSWVNRQKEILEDWQIFFESVIWICGGSTNINWIEDLWVAINNLKEQYKESSAYSQWTTWDSRMLENLQWKIDALDKLKKNYNLSDLWDYSVYEAQDWWFYVYVKYSDVNTIMPYDVYLYFNPNTSNLSMFTSWFDLSVINASANSNIWKSKISIVRNNIDISNEWLAIKKDSESIYHSCAGIFLDWTIDSALNWFLNIQSKADSLMFAVKENIETLEQYKLFPLQLYDWIHVEEKYLWEVASLVNSVLWTLSIWMETNANRYSQYVDAIISLITTLETYQLIIDLSADWTENCSTCTNDNYDQFSCKLWKICDLLNIELPVIEIPSTKIPSIYLDFSEIHVWMDVVIPNFVFDTVSVPLPELPNLPSPPNIDFSLNLDAGGWLDYLISQIKWVDFSKFSSINLWNIPLLPSPPNLPELPSLMPEIEMELPLLPPAPKIPQLPEKITAAIQGAKIIWKILCIVKWKFGLVWENSIKAKVEQITQRDYEIPFRDNMDLTSSDWNANIAAKMPTALASVFTWFSAFLATNQFKDVKLKWFDISLQTYINLQFDFDYLYMFLQSVVDKINEGSYFISDLANKWVDELSIVSKEFTDRLQACTNNPISVECNPDAAEQIRQYKQIWQNVIRYKNLVDNWFAGIWGILDKIEAKENRIENVHFEIDKLLVDSGNYSDLLVEYNNKLSVTYDETDREIILDKIQYTTKMMNSIWEDVERYRDEINELEQEIEDLDTEYWTTIQQYERLKNLYENSLWELSSLKDTLMQQSKNIINQVNDNIRQAWENVDFEKINQLNESINSWQIKSDAKKEQDKQRRSENLQDLYKDIDWVVSYVDYDPVVNESNFKILKNTLSEIDKQTNNKDIKNKAQEYLSLIAMDKKINANTDSINKIQVEYNTIISDYLSHNDEIVDLIEDDYDDFLVALSDKKTSLVNSNKHLDITLSANLFSMDKNTIKALSSQESLVKKYMDYNMRNVQWYLNALENFDAKTLNMTDKDYNLSKSYLEKIKALSDVVYDVIDDEWEDLWMSGWTEKSILLAQSLWWGWWSSTPSSSLSNTIDIANYIEWRSINTREWNFLLANEDYVKNFQSKFVLTDINWDNRSDLILWDNHNIYIKYRKNNSIYDNTKYYKSYYMHRIESYDDLVSQAVDGYVKIKDVYVKLVDQNREVKNFKYAWQTFDTIKVSWSNSSVVWDSVDWYLVKMIHRVDQFNDKENLINQWNNRELFDKKYVLVLQKWSEITGTKLELEEWILSNTERWIWTWNKIFSLLYYNDWSDTINLTISELPRNWQYSEVYTLNFEDNTYKISSSSSNQVVAWPQIIADTEWPDPDIKLYRPSTDKVVSEWSSLQWYVWTNYILQVDREDNVAMDEMWIFDEYGETWAVELNVNNKTGHIELSWLYFTWEEKLTYYILWVDINWNRYSTDVQLLIKTPSIEIIKILQWSQNLTYANWIVGFSPRTIWNILPTESNVDSVVTVVAELEHDIDSGFVQFFNNRVWNKLELLTWTVGSQWLSVSSFKVQAWMDTVYGWNFSMGNNIWLYSVSGNMVATVNPANWKITITPGYQNTIKIKLDYSSKIPIIKVMEWDKIIFWIIYSGEELVNVTTNSHHLSVQPLDNDEFGEFNWGKAVIRDWETLLYVSPRWQIYTEATLYWDYSFDESTQSVVYSFRTLPSWSNLWSVKVKIKNLLDY